MLRMDDSDSKHVQDQYFERDHNSKCVQVQYLGSGRQGHEHELHRLLGGGLAERITPLWYQRFFK